MTTKDSWKTVAIGGTTGILMGAGTMYAIQSLASDNSVEASTDDTLRVATSADGLSFRQAFDAARAEVGPGGVFRWHGNIYSTYTEEEWKAMSEQEHDLFAQRVKPEITPADIDARKVAEEATPVKEEPEDAVIAEEASPEDDDAPLITDATPNVEEQEDVVIAQTTPAEEEPEGVAVEADMVSVAEGNEELATAPADQANNGSQDNVEDDEDVRVVGFGHVEVAEGQYVAVGELEINGQRVAVVDVDNDGKGDIAMSDLNQNGQADDGEIIDLHTGESLAFTNEQDYPHDSEMAQDDSQPVDDGSDMLNFTI